LKRLLREAFRQSQDRIPAGFDYLLMISPPRFLAKARAGVKKSDTEKTVRLPTFEQLQASFLALVNSSLGTSDL
jgi:RNase P protein component